ncbi:hypothetical protein EYF80_011810 [Liparis tanakae]|uniref:Uncharacterized protein n=1 Tax=Liparis tanakae TaxID=230148 RepID=A0A4Z2IJK2_9TELE|nr:hypothetical protein EYF80_011810 [Liparis tanakae]
MIGILDDMAHSSLFVLMSTAVEVQRGRLSPNLRTHDTWYEQQNKTGINYYKASARAAALIRGLYMWQHNGVTVDVQDRRALFHRRRDGMCETVVGAGRRRV